jgi:small conductance mechanosensitive channel
MLQDLLNAAFLRSAAVNTIRILFILLFSVFCTWLAARLIRQIRKYAVRVMVATESATEYEIEKRANTVAGVVRKSIVGFVWAIAFIMILKELNFDIRPLLAGAGIVGVAVGFGAQNLIKDVLAGFFLLLENQIRVNDVAVINGTGGLVEEINLRTTVLRSDDGAVHIFPNGSITKLSNLTRDYSFYVFSVMVAYHTDTDVVVKELTALAEQLASEEPYRSAILAPLEIWGVDQLAESGVIVKARFKTLPMKQWLIGREMNRRIHKRFGEVGIDIPFPTRTIHLSPRDNARV